MLMGAVTGRLYLLALDLRAFGLNRVPIGTILANKKKESDMKTLLTIALLALMAIPASAADVYVKIKTHTDAMTMMGQSQPARDDVSEQWFSGSKMAQSGKDSGTIVDLDKNMAYMVNHRDKSYVELPLPMDITTILPPEAAAMAPMLQMTATVSATAETKKIGQWACTGYDATLSVMGMQMKLRIWASTQVPGELATFAAKVMPAFMQGTMRLTDAAAAEFAKIKGFQVATELNADVMGAIMHTTTETVEIVEKAAPSGTYAPPAGYAKKSTLSMQDLQRR
jgi:hypothetical protein